MQPIQMCQRLLGKDVSDLGELEQHDDADLQALAKRLASDIERRS